MAQPFTRYFRMNPRSQEVGSVSVPQIVETNAGQDLVVRNESDPFLADAVWFQRRSVQPRYDKIFIGQASTKFKQLLSPSNSVGAKFCYDRGRNGECPRAATFGFL